MTKSGITFMIIAICIGILFAGIQVGEANVKDKTIQKICFFTQPTLNDYTYCHQKNYDEVMFLLYRRLKYINN